MRKRLLTAGGYAAFFLASLLICFYLTFDPTHIVSEKVQSFARERGMQVSMDTVRKYRLSGINAEQVEVQLASLKSPVKIDSLKVRLSLIPLLLGRKEFGFEVRLYGGKAKGKIAQGKKSLAADFDLKSIDLARLEPAKENALWAQAKLSGKAEVNSSDTNNPQKWRGQVKADMGAGKMNPFSYQGFQIPEIKFDGVNLELAINAGKADIKTFKINGPDFPFDGRGEIELKTPFSESSMQLEAKIDPSEEYLSKMPALRALVPPDKTIKYNGSIGAITGRGI